MGHTQYRSFGRDAIFAPYAVHKRNPCPFDFHFSQAKLFSPDSNKRPFVGSDECRFHLHLQNCKIIRFYFIPLPWR
ncbi:hypothetical protein HDF15_000672 [Granulicella mallensis]|jgi:hypothetical protein|uniref:Uncharacterized protein n=1 Tax=Granulicella mallensis TaxID=940614 RepID=A0A7W8E9G3_9BACT|nr:hypothetical protein [Granulicella mallensis]